MLEKKVKILIAIVVGFVMLFLLSVSSFYFILKPKIDNADKDEVEEERYLDDEDLDDEE